MLAPFKSCAVFAFASLLISCVVSADTLDLDGLPHNLSRRCAVVFLGTECPIARQYIADLNNLPKSDFPVFGVISDPTVSRAHALKFRHDYEVAFPILMDTSGALAEQFHPTHTPHAFVLNDDGAVVYQGRIDDRFAALGKPKQVTTTHELSDAIVAVSTGKPLAVAKTDPVGCLFESWNHKPANLKITYTRDIAPIMQANCVNCHRDGEAAPFPLTSFADVSKRAELLVQVTESRYMPPWKPAPNFGHFADERLLSDREIALIQSWVDAGAPEGNASDLPPLRKFSSDWALGTPDMIIKMPESMTIPASGRDIYRAFVAPIDIPKDMYLAGFEFRADAKAVVHHCILYLDDTGKARELDAKDSEPGYKSFGGPGFPASGSLGGWAPGATPFLLPDGVGKPIAAKSDLVFQMHYHPDGKAHTDQSSIALYFHKKPVSTVVSGIVLANRDINIPAGEANYVRTAMFTLPVDTTLIGITPHMHLVGKEMRVFAITPDGTEVPLIWIKDWDFRWQDQYRFASPMTFPKDTRLEMTAAYDNSASNPRNPSNPPKQVSRGEQTTDEMCLCFLQYQTSNLQDIQTMRRALVTQKIKEKLGR